MCYTVIKEFVHSTIVLQVETQKARKGRQMAKKRKMNKSSRRMLPSVYSMSDESLPLIKRRARAHRRNLRNLHSRSGALDDIQPLRIWASEDAVWCNDE